MQKETLDRFLITAGRKLLRTADLLHINDDQLYKEYYQLIIKKLTPVLNTTWNQVNQLNFESNDTDNHRYIWFMWWQGIDDAPAIVQSNYHQLISIFGDRVKVICRDNYNQYTDVDKLILRRFESHDISFTQWSDIVRYNLLKSHGGLWIDSTVLVSPLIKRIPNLLDNDFVSLCAKANTSKFISFGRWTGWFVGGRAHYDLFEFMNQFFVNYYRSYNKTIDYFFADDAFFYFYQRSLELRQNIRDQAREWDPYLFVRHFPSTDINSQLKLFSTRTKYCVQKLTYKYNFSKSDDNSLARYLEHYHE